MNKSTLTYTILLALVLLVPGSALASTSSSFENTTVFVVDSFGGFVKDLNLKATQSEDGEIDAVSDFEIEPEDVVQVRQGTTFIVFTGASEDKVEKVKVTSVVGITTELVNVEGNTYTTQGLASGVYTLDIIVDTGDEKEVFETLLVILGPNENPVNPVIVINKFENIIKTKTIIKFNDDDDDNDDDGGNKTKDGGNKTKKPEGRICTMGMDASSRACAEGISVEEYCKKNPQTQGCPEPPICTPDGPECPPCPEGVEAGWCEDEDERQDFDCDDEGMEDDPRCKDREPVDDDCEDTGGSDPCGEEEDQNCGGVACTDNEKEDSWLEGEEEEISEEEEESETEEIEESSEEESEVVEEESG